MDGLELIAPATGIIALFAVIGAIVQLIRQGRAIRRLEDRLREGGVSAADASLERIRQLQTRAQISSGTAPRTGPAVTIGVVVALAVIAAGSWLLFFRGDSDPDTGEANPPAASTTERTSTTTEGGTATEGDGTTTASSEANPDRVPADVPPLANKAQVTVAVFNASGVSGAARGKVAPRLEDAGYFIGTVGDSPDGRSDLSRSFVMWPEGKQEVAWNVANDLGIRDAPQLDGLTREQIGNADVAVFIGTDLANS
jgi:hypothetical protein